MVDSTVQFGSHICFCNYGLLLWYTNVPQPTLLYSTVQYGKHMFPQLWCTVLLNMVTNYFCNYGLQYCLIWWKNISATMVYRTMCTLLHSDCMFYVSYSLCTQNWFVPCALVTAYFSVCSGLLQCEIYCWLAGIGYKLCCQIHRGCGVGH